MANNITITPEGKDVATNEVTGTLEHVQLFKLAYSADGVRTLVPAGASGLSVTGPLTDTELRTSDVPVTDGQVLGEVQGINNLNALTTKVQDQNYTALDYGRPVLILRKDTPANTSGSDLDYEFPQMSAGRLWTSAVVTGSVAVTGAFFQVTQPVSAAALPLPAGAATETGHLAAIDTATARIPAQGQALAAASTPVVLTAAQVTTLTPPAAITGFATETTLGAVKTAVELIDNAVSGAGFNVTQQGGVAVSLNAGVRDTGTQRVTIATNDVVPVTGTFWQATQPVSGTVTTTPPANASTNLAQIVGTAADVNSGVKSAGTLRVVLATDQPALTNKLLVTPDSVALPANQSVNAAQFGGTNVSTGTGAGGAGIPRVTVSNDSAIKLWDGTNTTTVKAASTAAAFTDVAATVDIRPGGVLPVAAASADGLTNPTITQIGSVQLLFNGTTWDRARGNWRTTTGDTGAKTVTFNGATQTNFDSLGAWITVQLGTVSGTTPTLSCQMQFSYDAGTTFLNFGAALTNLTTSNQTGLIIVYPANISQAAGVTPATLTSGATVMMAINAPLPRTWRIVYTLAGTTPNFAITNVHVNYAR
jgi:hypothetical protein